MSSTALKRTWSRTSPGSQGTSGEQETTSYLGVPLPKINGETLLQVLTHRSLRRPDDASENFDNERLSELGARVLDTAITTTLFHRRPVLSGLEMLVQRKRILSEENLDGWVSMYSLREKVRCTREVVSTLKSPEETRILFNSYVGGLYKEQGLEAVQRWLDGLTHDDTAIKPSVTTKKKAKADPSIFIAAQPLPSSSQFFMPPTVFPTQQYTVSGPFANPLSPAQPDLPFLPLFNQTATKRRVAVDYPANCSGPPHAPKWIIQCKVNGILKGTGTGKSKQEAKELAARNAWYNLGWS
ncbi:hypothetical protein GGU11DRAFT_6133 [Lentinula aff. detonsa]|nr:hypothetical protein GGU11DRAFT_6133 [Lentinula aff. detonsa]